MNGGCRTSFAALRRFAMASSPIDTATSHKDLGAYEEEGEVKAPRAAE